jgi:hypothetical protein
LELEAAAQDREAEGQELQRQESCE